MVLQVGEKLQNGKYTIEKRLGGGRFAITYLASKSDGERRVIKILDPQVLAELAALVPPEADRLRGQFWQEAVNLARCILCRWIRLLRSMVFIIYRWTMLRAIVWPIEIL